MRQIVLFRKEGATKFFIVRPVDDEPCRPAGAIRQQIRSKATNNGIRMCQATLSDYAKYCYILMPMLTKNVKRVFVSNKG